MSCLLLHYCEAILSPRVPPLSLRLLDKGSYSVSASGAPLPPSRTPQSPEAPIVFNPETDVVLDAFGGLQVGVSVADEAWDWDDGAWDFEQWLKRQSAFPDDNELEQTLPPECVCLSPRVCPSQLEGDTFIFSVSASTASFCRLTARGLMETVSACSGAPCCCVCLYSCAQLYPQPQLRELQIRRGP